MTDLSREPSHDTARDPSHAPSLDTARDLPHAPSHDTARDLPHAPSHDTARDLPRVPSHDTAHDPSRAVPSGLSACHARGSRPAQSHVQPRTGMVLTAGLATRMRPLTNHTAKPLLTLQGTTLLDHALDRLAAVGVETAAVNGHWHADKVEAALAIRQSLPATVFLRESALLDTGGSVRDAQAVLGPGPFYVLNGDAYWLDGPTRALTRLAQAFDDSVDAVLLLHRTAQVTGEVGPGDFTLSPAGVPRRRREREVVPYLYAGAHLMRPELLDGMPDTGAYSINRAWDRAMAAGRLRAIVHDGPWFHLSTPDDLADAEQRLADRFSVDLRSPWL